MRKLIFTAFFSLCLFGVVNAQEKGLTFIFSTQSYPWSLNKHSEYKAVGFNINPGYNFNDSFFARLHCEVVIGMFNASSVKTYDTNGVLGAAVGYNLIKSPSEDILEITATVGNSVGNRHWNFLCYDAALRWSFPSSSYIKASFGLGVRYSQSHNGNHPDYCNVYASIGFRFN